MTGVHIRRVRLHEWEKVRELRITAVEDPAASIAFHSTPASERARSEKSWQDRTIGAAIGDHAAQFIAESGPLWLGTLTVLASAAGERDHTGTIRDTPYAHIVGVFVRDTARGRGVIDRLVEEGVAWAGSLGAPEVALEVHVDNERAHAVYRRNGFTDTGDLLPGPNGMERLMTRPADIVRA